MAKKKARKKVKARKRTTTRRKVARKKTARKTTRRKVARRKVARRKTVHKAVTATMTCPECGHKQGMKKKSNKAVGSYMCEGCGKYVPAKDKCVFCEYSNKPCPCCK